MNSHIVEIRTDYPIDLDDIHNIAEAVKMYPNHTIYKYDLGNDEDTVAYIFADSKKSAIDHIFSIYDVMVSEDDLDDGM